MILSNSNTRTQVAGSIEWLTDIEQFYRERSAIEKEYSAKLSALAKKYFEKRARKSSSMSVGDNPVTTPGSLERYVCLLCSPDIELIIPSSASMTTWGVQLTTLENRAAEHDRFAGELVSNLADPIKHLSGRCEDLRKLHADYAVKLEKERDSTYGDLRKQKGRYDSECQDVESRRKKIESSFDSSKSKAQSAYHQQMSNMHNAKNTYLVGIHVANKQKERYYHNYVPELLDSLQDLSEARISKLNAIWIQAARIESSVLSRSSDYVKHLADEVPRNNPALDSMMFVRHNSGSWQEPVDFAFEPSPVWLDDDAMARDEASKTFLRNVLLKSKGQLSELRRDTESKRRELDGLKRKRQAIKDGKDSNDEIEVARSLIQVHEQHHETERKKISAEVEVATITSAVGDLSQGARNHNFKQQTFKIPTNCDLCGDRLWGLSAKGFDCKDCGYICHSKCEMKVPADCPGEQTKEEKRKLKVERQEMAHASREVEDIVPEKSAGAAPLNRSNTANSMNTLSSGFAMSASRSVVDGADTNGRSRQASSASRNKIMAALAQRDGDASGSDERHGKMLYAYSKNEDGELTVSEGQDVVLIEPDGRSPFLSVEEQLLTSCADGSGWMKVSMHGQEGLVPASYVELSALAASDNDRHSVYSASSASLAGSISGAAPAKKKGPAVAPRRGAKKVRQVEALYDYDARTDAEHSMTEGEKFVLVREDQGDGWAEVERGGAVKSVPANYIKSV